ncbi:MAG: hypothetical protein JXR44_05495 [Thiotrichales bacterium]|nr:hypothetical protein [Thiotrichales bacterium]
MKQPKASFTWHYYFMALGALLAMLAATLGAIGAIVAGLAIAVISHPRLRFQGVGRFVFYTLFFVIYVFAFPEPETIRQIMQAS